MPLGNFRLGNPPPTFQNPNNSFGQPNWLNMGQTVLRGAQRVMPYLSQAGIQIPPAVNFLMKGLGGISGGFKGGYPQQGFPQQGIPQQGLPQQGIPQQGYPSQGFFSQGFPPQMYQQQGGALNNTLNVQQQPFQYPSQPFQPARQFQIQPQFLAQPQPQAQIQSQAQLLPQQVPQSAAKGGGIKAFISNFLARRKAK